MSLASASARRVRDGRRRDHRALERERLRVRSVSSGAARAARTAPRGARRAGRWRPLRLEQRAQREQVVGERLAWALALAAQLEAPQRPGELVAVRRATRDEVAERAQLVLLLGRDHEHPARAPAGAERERAPGAAADA